MTTPAKDTGTGTGRLYGVGLGPGDPNLMTLRAVQAIGDADVVAYHSARHGRSIARSIAAAHLRSDHIEEALVYPVTTETTDHPGGYRGALEEFYEKAAARLAAHLDAGRTVAVLAEGDPMFYGSYMHMHKRLADRYPTEVIPGVTSVSAAAARLGTPLVEGEEILTILPGTLPEEELTARLAATDTAVVMKLGRTFPAVRGAFEASGRLGEARYVERATMAGERTGELADIDPESVPYFSVAVLPSRVDAPRPSPSAGGGVVVVGHRPGGPAVADAGDARGARRRRRRGRLHHLPGPGAGPAGPGAARLGQQGGVGAGRVRPGPGPARPPGRGGLGRRPRGLRDGDGGPGGGLAGGVRGPSRAGPARGHRRQRGGRPRGRPTRPRLRHDLPLGPAQAVGGHRGAPARRAAAADLVLALYNPGSKSRTWQVGQARDLLLEHRSPDTPVVLARDVGGPTESVRTVRLADLDPAEVDMRTLLIVGSSQTRWVRRGEGGDTVVWTPRRYPEA
ncbi:Siroheme synthase [Streptomyces californicus]